MGGVTDEAAHLVDGALTVLERVVDPLEHRVEGAVEAADLGVRGVGVESLVEVTGGEPRGRVLDVAQRVERGRDEEAREHRAEQDHRDAEEQEDDGEAQDGLIGVRARHGDEDVPGLGRARREVLQVRRDDLGAPFVAVLLVVQAERVHGGRRGSEVDAGDVRLRRGLGVADLLTVSVVGSDVGLFSRTTDSLQYCSPSLTFCPSSCELVVFTWVSSCRLR